MLFNTRKPFQPFIGIKLLVFIYGSVSWIGLRVVLAVIAERLSLFQTMQGKETLQFAMFYHISNSNNL